MFYVVLPQAMWYFWWDGNLLMFASVRLLQLQIGFNTTIQRAQSEGLRPDSLYDVCHKMSHIRHRLKCHCRVAVGFTITITSYCLHIYRWSTFIFAGRHRTWTTACIHSNWFRWSQPPRYLPWLFLDEVLPSSMLHCVTWVCWCCCLSTSTFTKSIRKRDIHVK